MTHGNIQFIPMPTSQEIKRAKQYSMFLHVWDVWDLCVYMVRVGEEMSSFLTEVTLSVSELYSSI